MLPRLATYMQSFQYKLLNNVLFLNKKLHIFGTKYETSYFQWLQLISAIPERWKFLIKKTHESTTNLIIHDHHVIKGSRILTLDKLASTEIYSILFSKLQSKPSSNFYFENLFNDNDIDWATIFMLPRLAIYMQSFQYRLLNNALFLNEKLHIFGIKSSHSLFAGLWIHPKLL